MQLHVLNNLTRTLEPFQPINKEEVRVYSCGPTVYNSVHIGNLRSFLAADMIQRVLRTVGGYAVKWVMNVTDIDDKTIRDSAIGADTWIAEEMGEQTRDVMQNLKSLTDYYTRKFVQDIEKVRIQTHNMAEMPRATSYIQEMQNLVSRIAENGFAYESGGSIYFNVSKWSETGRYGQLRKIDFDNFRSGVRIDADEYDREQVSDFALWKGKKDDEPFWEFEFQGRSVPGRPGWHLECSAMEREILGLPFDVHTGGVDLKFPHHEDEIAQSEAGYGVKPTTYWMHNEFLEVEGKKMSKSLGNFYKLDDLIEKGVDPLDVRYLMNSVQYSTKLNFTFAGIEASKKARLRVQEYIYTLYDDGDGTHVVDAQELVTSVFAELAQDINTPKALGVLFGWLNAHPAATIATESRQHVLDALAKINEVFDVWTIEPRPAVEIPADIVELAERRKTARATRDWAEADKMRDALQAAGWVCKDTKDGYELTKL